MSRTTGAPRATSLRSDRALLLTVAALLIALAWLALLRHPEPAAHGHSAAAHSGAAGLAALSLAFSMWMLMLVAMMLPVVLPWFVVFTGFSRAREPLAAPHVPALALASGYFAIWSGYSVLGALAQVALQRSGWLGADLEIGRMAGSALLVVAGLFQLSPAKQACLSHCRSPLAYFMARWREGPRGAFSMGWHHGLFCLGCCWALMLLMFAAGLMHLVWMAALTLLMLAEQVAPRRWRVAHVAGAGLVAWGVWRLVAGP